MKAKYVADANLEIISDTVSQPHAKQIDIPAKLRAVWNFILNVLKQASELQVQEFRDRSGNVWWSVYDPATGRSAWLASEDEVRMWIEKNY